MAQRVIKIIIPAIEYLRTALYYKKGALQLGQYLLSSLSATATCKFQFPVLKHPRNEHHQHRFLSVLPSYGSLVTSKPQGMNI